MKLYQEFLWASSPQASYWILTATKKKIVVDENVLQIVATKVLHHVCIKTCNGVGVEVVEKCKYN